jgi:transcriptional regulator with XRE-family HTH domain
MNERDEVVRFEHAGQVIASRLKEMGKSQAWLKDQVGVSHTAVSLWIRSGMISYKHAKKVAAVLNIPAHEMLGVTSEKDIEEAREPGGSMIVQYTTPEEAELLNAWRETDENGRSILSAVARQVPRRKIDQAN